MPDPLEHLPPPYYDTRVEEHIRDRIELWMPHYLTRLDQAAERAKPTPMPKVYVSDDETVWEEQKPPALLIVCAGSLDRFKLHMPAGRLSGWVQVNTVVTAGAATEPGVRALKHLYAGALRELLLAQLRGELIAQVELLGWRNDLLTKSRKYAAAGVRIACQIKSIGDAYPQLPDRPEQPGPSDLAPTGARVTVTRTSPEST